jgi:hypothetical protein
MPDKKKKHSPDIPREAKDSSTNKFPSTPSKGDNDSDGRNPSRTTKGWLTSPKFGSATSGGGEIDPGPEKD